MDSPTKFVAIVNKVQTLADNGLRVYLDLPEQAHQPDPGLQRQLSRKIRYSQPVPSPSP